MGLRHNFQTIAWFWDLQRRKLLNLNPTYQRRSVWNQAFKDFFIDTILLSFPAPAIFLYEEIDENGRATYNVVDGKQRLTTVFEFLEDHFPVYESASIPALKGKSFSDFDRDTKQKFYGYEFLVEYLPSSEESTINNIFDRINRNVAKLTYQELRHAKFDGAFISTAERLSEWMFEQLPAGFPRLTGKSKRQMKDVEMVATLLLLLEEGPQQHSQEYLDKSFADRETEWEQENEVEEKFRSVVVDIKKILDSDKSLISTRLRNQADFYSFFGAIAEMIAKGEPIVHSAIAQRLMNFLCSVDSDSVHEENSDAAQYHFFARSASTHLRSRSARIDIILRVIRSEAK